MPSGLGYYSGLLEGRKTLQDMALNERKTGIQEQELQLRREQEARQLEESKSSNLMRMAQREQLLRKFSEEDQTKALLQKTYSANIPTAIADNKAKSISSLGDETITTGRALLGVNPKVGLEMIKAGQTAKAQAGIDEVRNENIKAARAERAGQIMSTVTDQSTLDEAVQELASLGQEVPERFRTWSPETKVWLENRSIASQRVLESTRIQNQAKQIELTEEENASKQKARLKKQKLDEQKEERLRNKVYASRKIKTIPTKELQAEVAGLNQIPEFDALDKGAKLQAARDVYSLATAYLADGTAENQAVAMARAREEIRKRIDAETGTYKGFDAEAKTQVPSQSEWMAKAKQANPNATDAQLKAFYDKKYGGYVPNQTTLEKEPTNFKDAEALVKGQIGN